MTNVSIVIPSKNEATALEKLLPEIRQYAPEARIIVVDDGSDDATADVASKNGATVITHPYSLGNGAAVKSGLRAVDTDYVICMDGDLQHSPEDIPRLIEKLEQGYDMVVGARSNDSQASFGRRLANHFYNFLASLIVGHPIADLTSGFRAARTRLIQEFIYLLPNGFSYPTTTTMAFFRAGYRVTYIQITARERIGKSHINWFKDGLRFILIIMKIGTLYSPLKFFAPLSASMFFAGLGYYAYTYITDGRFTNMSALLFSTSIITFLIGLVSEQITTLIYENHGNSTSRQR